VAVTARAEERLKKLGIVTGNVGRRQPPTLKRPAATEVTAGRKFGSMGLGRVELPTSRLSAARGQRRLAPLSVTPLESRIRRRPALACASSFVTGNVTESQQGRVRVTFVISPRPFAAAHRSVGDSAVPRRKRSPTRPPPGSPGAGSGRPWSRTWSSDLYSQPDAVLRRRRPAGAARLRRRDQRRHQRGALRLRLRRGLKLEQASLYPEVNAEHLARVSRRCGTGCRSASPWRKSPP